MKNSEENQKFPVCFQVWNNGGVQTSAWYWSNVFNYRKDKDDFSVMVENHEEYRKSGNSIARLVIFNSQKELDESIFA